MLRLLAWQVAERTQPSLFYSNNLPTKYDLTLAVDHAPWSTLPSKAAICRFQIVKQILALETAVLLGKRK